MKNFYLIICAAAFCWNVTIQAQEIAPSSYSSDLLKEQVKWVNPENMRNYLSDLKKEGKTDIALLEQKLEKIEKLLSEVNKIVLKPVITGKEKETIERLLKLKKEIMLANPLLDADKIIVGRYRLGDKDRKAMAPSLGTAPNNWASLLSSRRSGYDAEIAELSNLRGDIKSRTIYKPTTDIPVSDIQLHWDGGRILFSSLDSLKRWQIYEVNVDGSNFHQKINVNEPDLEFCDANYLPDGKIVATTNIGYNGVPCVHGSDMVANLISYDPATNALRRLTFDQDGNWNPIVIPNGRIMYTRWEYTDLTHYFSRIVMHMNPDGTENKALYGSGSFFPNSTFDMKPLSKNNNRFVGIISGHHGIARSGRLIIFDPAKGRKEEKGMIQELPFSTRKIEPIIKDELVNGVWPQFIKPYPLSEKYFLVAAKLTPDALWGVYLVDVFDNLTLIAEFDGEGLIAPVLLHKTETPPVIPSKIKPEEKESTVFIQDIYEGEGTQGIPRGTIKSLRIFAYEYAYVQSPSDHDAQGIQSGWDIKRVLGTVPVEEDGSVIFKIPANTPVSLQPLDKNGAAVQWMRSWVVGMPGEVVSCIGCHEDQNTIPIPKKTIASQRAPHTMTQPEGGIRPFTFKLEVQPVLDRNCIACHNGEKDIPDFRKDQMVLYKRGNYTKIERNYDQSYLNLHPYVYRQGPEADIYVLRPYEYYANNSELIRILQAGHHGVTLSDNDWKTLYTWIDLNAPYFSAFTQLQPFKGCDQVKRRQELSEKYSGVKVNWQKEIEDYAAYLKKQGDSVVVSVSNEVSSKKEKNLKQKGFPFTATVAKEKQQSRKEGITRSMEVAPGVAIELVWIPAGKFVTGNNRREEIKKGFWMSTTEITNKQFTALFPEHDSRYIGQTWKDHTTPGYPANTPQQPVIRISWDEANAFCRKLSEKNNCIVALPTESQWEWAARAGSDTDFWYGTQQDNFATYENLADTTLTDMAVSGVNPRPMRPNDSMRQYWDYLPKVKDVNDHQLISAPVANYKPNPWGLYDMNGNVAEWTNSDYNPEQKVVRGGSWIERPKYATAVARKPFYAWQRPFNVGFRVIIEE